MTYFHSVNAAGMAVGIVGSAAPCGPTPQIVRWNASGAVVAELGQLGGEGLHPNMMWAGIEP